MSLRMPLHGLDAERLIARIRDSGIGDDTVSASAGPPCRARRSRGGRKARQSCAYVAERVEAGGIEPPTSACKADVFPLAPRPRGAPA